jgi:serine/threonine protein kinase
VHSELRFHLFTHSWIQQTFHQLAITSKYLKHPNIVPLLGATTDPLELISDWMPYGDLPGYIGKHPGADRRYLVWFISTTSAQCDALTLCQLSDVAEGLEYLHSCNLIHGDLKGVRTYSTSRFTTLMPSQSNILIDGARRARITDFGVSVITQDLDLIRNASPERDPGTRWIAPEILDNRGTYSNEADVFSFAGVAIEVRCRYNHSGQQLMQMNCVYFNEGFHWCRSV